ncbi:hypothetical protein FAZ69_07570 [Trinickia terrae]|uniref:Uncharacterized protein n=1 Tax=Trinickia terrae TaxID=2571161 RepID=A0A4U1ICF6_9BURK|nr:hypothetical protein [Trinickia terrae]TKC91207.1 hypothetical protein FAZ69_07570 [Trinickia terrae]
MPEHRDLRACVKAIQEDRKGRAVRTAAPPWSDTPSPAQVLYGNRSRVPQNLGTPSYSPGTGTPLGDAQSFQYSESAEGGELRVLAARGVSEQSEGECFSEYEFDLEQCNFIRALTQDFRAFAVCKQTAFENYQRCRGY